MSNVRTAAVRVEERKVIIILPIAPEIVTGLPGA
jgi:hypothetical protein